MVEGSLPAYQTDADCVLNRNAATTSLRTKATANNPDVRVIRFAPACFVTTARHRSAARTSGRRCPDARDNCAMPGARDHGARPFGVSFRDLPLQPLPEGLVLDR